MNKDGKKRPPRTPLSPEEVAELVLLKKIRERKKLEKFKSTSGYKIANIFNIACFFIYLEMIACFFGPCHYETHYNKKVIVEYGEARNKKQERIISGIKLVGVDNKQYAFVVNDFIKIPEKYSPFEVGRDFLLQKEIKGTLPTSDDLYHLEKASPIIFLSFLVGVFSLIIFFFDLNQNPYSLRAITIINALTVFSFVMI